jgi:hypothetical protein
LKNEYVSTTKKEQETFDEEEKNNMQRNRDNKFDMVLHNFGSMIPALSCKNIKEKQQPTQPQIDLQVSII